VPLSAEIGKSGTDGRLSDVRVVSIVWLLMIGDFQSRGTSRVSPGTPTRDPVFPVPSTIVFSCPFGLLRYYWKGYHYMCGETAANIRAMLCGEAMVALTTQMLFCKPFPQVLGSGVLKKNDASLKETRVAGLNFPRARLP
jgi:hypothetical protein